MKFRAMVALRTICCAATTIGLGAQSVSFSTAEPARLPLVLLSSGMLRGLPCIEAEFGAHRVLVMLDTGFTHAAVDGAVCVRAGLEQRGSDHLFGVGNSRSVPLYRDASLKLGDVTFESRIVHGPDLSAFAAGRGRAIDGILGGTFFEGCVVTIDYGRREVVLQRPEDYEPPEGASVVPLRFSLGTPEVRASLDGDRSRPYLIDTGAEPTLMLNAPYVARAGLIDDAQRFPHDAIGGFAGSLGVRHGRLARFAFGELSATDVPVMMLEAPATLALAGDQRRAGTVGSGMFVGARVTIDYRGRRLVVQPPEQGLRPEPTTAIGFEVRVDGDQRHVVVGHLRDKKVAAELDVARGDRVVAVDGEPPSADLGRLRDVLAAQAETVLRLERGGVERDVAWPRAEPLPLVVLPTGGEGR